MNQAISQTPKQSAFGQERCALCGVPRTFDEIANSNVSYSHRVRINERLEIAMTPVLTHGGIVPLCEKCWSGLITVTRFEPEEPKNA